MAHALTIKEIENGLKNSPFLLDIVKFYSPELEIKDASVLDVLDPRVFSFLPRNKRRELTRLFISGLVSLVKREIVYDPALVLSYFDLKPSFSQSPQDVLKQLDEPHFALTLQHYIPPDRFGLRAPNVLSIACGLDLEARTVRNYFAGVAGNSSIHVGIDNNPRSKEDSSALYSKDDWYHFILGDAAKLETRQSLDAINTSFDMIVMRHAPVIPGGNLWREAINEYMQYLKEGGMLLMTLYYPGEFDIVMKGGFPSSLKIQVAERNKARAYNKALSDLVREGERNAPMNGLQNGEQYFGPADSVGNTSRRDQYIIIALKT